MAASDVPLKASASLVLYLVSPDYAVRAGPPYGFLLDRERIEAEGCHVFFSSAVSLGGGGTALTIMSNNGARFVNGVSRSSVDVPSRAEA